MHGIIQNFKYSVFYIYKIAEMYICRPGYLASTF